MNSRFEHVNPGTSVREGERTWMERLTLSLKSVELVEQGGNVNDDTGSDKGVDLWVDQTCTRVSPNFA